MPILTGAVSRVPLGLLTDKLGGRNVMLAVMMLVAVPLLLLSFAGSFVHFVLCSLGFDVAGGAFAVGVGYVSSWYTQERQGTALGFFGMGNAGAATTLLAPTLLDVFAADDPDGWRMLPRFYAGLVASMAIVFFPLTKPRKAQHSGPPRTLGQRLAPLKNVVVWRFGLYYLMVFGSFVSLAQWIVPYGTNVYGLSVAQAGLIASAFSLPSGVVRAAGGWLSDRYGARTVMYWVFGGCLVVCAILAIPRMEVESPGQGVNAKSPGVVSAVSSESVVVGENRYALEDPPEKTPAELDDGTQVLPTVSSWHAPVVEEGEKVVEKQLVARGTTNIYYPANMWIFAVLAVLIGLATGIGKAGVYKFIPDQFPDQVGAVGGMVGLLGGLGGFVLPPIFGIALEGTGLWSSCWIVLAVLAFVCLAWMHTVVRRIEKEDAPDLANLLERRPDAVVDDRLNTQQVEQMTIRGLLGRVPFFEGMGKEELKILGEKGTRMELQRGERVFERGEAGDSLYVILYGAVRIHRGDTELATLEEGDFFGELALLDGDVRSASATTVTKTALLALHRNDFLTQLNRSPHMVSVLLAALSQRIRKAADRMQGDDVDHKPWLRKDLR